MELSTPEARHVSGADTPLNASERAALRSFRRAALTSRGYRAHLEHLGVDHRTVTRLSQVPYTDKRSVFGDHIDFWLDGGRVTEAAELLTSSGADRPLLGRRHLALGAARAGAHVRPDPARAGRRRGHLDAAPQLPADGHLDPHQAGDGRHAVGAPGDGGRAARPDRAELRPGDHRGRAAVPEGAGRDGAARARARTSPTAWSPASSAASGSPRAGAATCPSSSASPTAPPSASA